MIRNKDILNCLPLLASALGDRYGVKVEIGGTRAYTNGKTIQIPALPTNCDKTAIALAKGYVDHESAHIRHTDFNQLRLAHMDSVTSHICNSIEDWRVEKCLSELYPGCRNNLDWLVRRVFLEEEREEAGKISPASSVLNYILLTVRSWNVEEIKPLLQKTRELVDNAFPGLSASIDNVLAEARLNCADTKAAIVYASRIASIIRRYVPPDNSSEKERQSSAKSGSPISGANTGQKEDNPQSGRIEEPAPDPGENPCGHPSENHGKDSSVDAASDGNTNTSQASDCQVDDNGQTIMDEEDASGSQSNSATDNEGENKDKTRYDLDELKSLFDKPKDELPLNLGEIIAEKLNGSCASKPEEGLCVASRVEREAGRLPDEEKAMALRSSNALRQRLAGLLQAHQSGHVASGKRGKLNPSSIHRLSVGNPRVFRKEGRVPGQNSAVHILLDASYSMENEPIRLARQACYAVVTALKTIRGVNPAVTAFPADVFGNVCQLLEHSQKLSDRFLVEANGSTPLAPALWWVMKTLFPMPEERKIILVITDGIPDNVPAVMDAIKMIRKLGMEIYGIGIKIQAIGEILPKKCRVIRSLDELAPSMFEMLQNALLKGVAR